MSTGEKKIDAANAKLKTSLVIPWAASPDGRMKCDLVLWEGVSVPATGLPLGALPQGPHPAPSEPWRSAYTRWQANLPCGPERKKEMRLYEKHLAEFFGEKTLAAITMADVEKMVLSLQAKGLKAKTVKNYLANVRQFLGWCVDHDLIAKNPAKRVKAPKGESREGVPFSVEEAKALLKECSKKDWLFGLVFVGLRTGLRRANIHGMTWAQVDLEQRKISVQAKQMKMKRRHQVPIHAELLEWLRERKERLQPQPEDLVIEKMPAGEVNNRSYNAAVERAGIKEEHTVHDLRHTVSTWLAEAGVERGLRDLILAHENRTGDMSAKYTHHRWESVLAAIDKAPRLLEEESK